MENNKIELNTKTFGIVSLDTESEYFLKNKEFFEKVDTSDKPLVYIESDDTWNDSCYYDLLMIDEDYMNVIPVPVVLDYMNVDSNVEHRDAMDVLENVLEYNLNIISKDDYEERRDMIEACKLYSYVIAHKNSFGKFKPIIERLFFSSVDNYLNDKYNIYVYTSDNDEHYIGSELDDDICLISKQYHLEYMLNQILDGEKELRDKCKYPKFKKSNKTLKNIIKKYYSNSNIIIDELYENGEILNSNNNRIVYRDENFVYKCKGNRLIPLQSIEELYEFVDKNMYYDEED